MASYQANQGDLENPYGVDPITTNSAYEDPQGAANYGQGGQQQQSQQQSDVIKSGMNAIKSPKGIVRLVLWFFSLLAFSIMASFKYYKGSGPWEFVVAANVLAWLCSTAFIAIYYFRDRVDRIDFCANFPIIEFALDGVLFLLTFVAACTAASKCAASGWNLLCDDDTHSKGGIAFSFLTAFTYVGAIFLSWRENRRLEAQHST